VSRLAHTNHTEDLDAGLVEPYNRTDQIAGDPVLRDGHGPLPLLPRTPLAAVAGYRCAVARRSWHTCSPA
jgi:hypothetical protein